MGGRPRGGWKTQQFGALSPGSGSGAIRKADACARVPVAKRLLLEKQELPSFAVRVSGEHRRKMAVVAKDNCLARKHRRDGVVFTRLIIERMIAIADKKIDSLVHPGK